MPWGNVHTGVTISALTLRMENHAYFRLPRHRLFDRLAFGISTDGCGRYCDHSRTRWNAIAVSAGSRRRSAEPPGLTARSLRPHAAVGEATGTTPCTFSRTPSITSRWVF